MVKGEVNHRQKATMEQVRLAQVTQDAHSVSDSALTSQIKKVMELTRCSQAEAEVALFDHDNNVEGAVLAVFDRPEKDNMWKETKGRKSKKLETNEKEDYYGTRRSDPSKANRGRNPSYQSRGGANPRTPRDAQGQDQRRDRPQQSNRGNTSSRGGHRPSNNGSALKDKNADEQQKFPAIDSFTSDLGNNDDENTWKNGPLVFEQSVAAAPVAQTPVANQASSVPSKSEKLSFAAVAASKKVLPPPPPAPPAAPSISTTSHVSSSKSIESQHKPEQIKEATSPSVREYTSSITEQNEPSPASLISTSVPSTSFGPAVASNTVNKEFTDKLKNDIGIGLHSTPAVPINSLETAAVLQARSPVSSSVLDTSSNSIPATQSNSLLHDVEFVSGDGPSMLDFQFGFHPDAQPTVDNMLSDRQQQLQQQQQQLIKGREAANNALSYMNTCSLEYQSNDLRGNNNGSGLAQKTSSQQQQPLNPSVSLQQQQQPSAQQQHNSLQQQQQQMYAAAAAQFPGYGIPYLYSPVASNMRDVDQLNSFTAMTPFAYGLNSINQLDMQMNAMLPPSATPQASAMSSQNHHQSQTASSQHRGAPPVDNNNKFQQGNVSSTNGLQSNNSYSQLGSQSGHQLRNQGGMDNGAAAAGPNAVAPPPGFSGPPFLTQPSFQSLFQLPSYTHPQLTMPYFLQGNTQQRQPQSQHAPQPASLQQQPHHQRTAEHASYLDMNKYPQQASITTTTNSNNMLPQSGNSYQSLGSGPLQSGHQQRNQQGVAGAGGLDNMQYYQPSKWSGGNGGGWRA